MGGGQSISQYVSNNIEFEQTTNMLNKVTTSSNVSTNLKLNSDIQFEVDDLQFNGNIDVSQFANVDINVYSITSAGLTQKQIADIQNSVQSDCKAMLAKANEDFGAVLGAAQAGQNSNTVIENAIKNSVTQNVTQETVASLFAQANVDATSTIVFRAKKLVFNGNLQVGQTIIVTLVAQLMVQSVVDAVLETKAVNDLANKVEDEVTATNTGLGTVIQKAGEAISGILQSSQFIFLVIGVVVVAGVYLYIKNGGGGGGGGGGGRLGSVAAAARFTPYGRAASMLGMFPGGGAPQQQQQQQPAPYPYPGGPPGADVTPTPAYPSTFPTYPPAAGPPVPSYAPPPSNYAPPPSNFVPPRPASFTPPPTSYAAPRPSYAPPRPSFTPPTSGFAPRRV